MHVVIRRIAQASPLRLFRRKSAHGYARLPPPNSLLLFHIRGVVYGAHRLLRMARRGYRLLFCLIRLGARAFDTAYLHQARDRYFNFRA